MTPVDNTFHFSHLCIVSFFGTKYSKSCTLGPTYNEFRYNEQPGTVNRFFASKSLTVIKFGYNEYPPVASFSFASFYSL